jgi:hypothetical protein
VQDGDESCMVLLQGRKEVALQCSSSEDDGSGLAQLDEEWGGEGRCRGCCSAGVGARPWPQLGMAGVAPTRRRQQHWREANSGTTTQQSSSSNDKQATKQQSKVAATAK